MSLTVSIALALGGLCILAVLVKYMRGSTDIKDMSVGLIGVVLMGMVMFNKFGLKVGPDGTFEGNWEGSILFADATTAAKVQALSDEISTLKQQVTAVASTNPAVESKVAAIGQQNQPSPEVIENSKFTILVFYRDQQQGKARKLVDELLSKGFKATSVATDLSEAVQQYDPGTSWIVWADSAKSLTSRLSNVVSTVAPGTPIKVRETAYDLKRGDVQILLF